MIHGLTSRLRRIARPVVHALPPAVQQVIRSAATSRRVRSGNGAALQAEVDTLYAALYEMAHDVEQSAAFATARTKAAFGFQWAHLPSGKYMLTDPAFKANVHRIITDEEILLRADWFPGKRVLDAGCGGGRWSYGLARLGAAVTAADTNSSALAATRAALDELGVAGAFVQSDLETLDQKLEPESFDLVWSWGVVHHCGSVTRALASLTTLLRPNGILFLYLYGRESLSFEDDVALFKERMRFNYLGTREARMAFLQEKAAGSSIDVHHLHDIYAPLVNRRFTFPEVEEILRALGYGHVERTKEHGEIWVRAIKGTGEETLKDFGLPPPHPPYWFQR